MKKLLKHIQYIAFKAIRFISNSIQFNSGVLVLYLKPGMEQTETETERNHTERKKIGLKHGNGISEHGTIKKWNKKRFFLIYFRLKCGTIKTRKRNVPHGIIF